MTQLEPDWRKISERLGVEDARAMAIYDISPILANAPREETDKDGKPTTGLEGVIGTGFFGFFIVFSALAFLTPDTTWMNALKIILFLPMFIGVLVLGLYINREKLAALITRGKARYLARAQAMKVIADAAGLDYAPSPGGPPNGIEMLEKVPFLPESLKTLSAIFQGGPDMSEAVDAARRSGLTHNNVVVIGSAETRRKFKESQGHLRNVENGFFGQRGDVGFHAFQVTESMDDEPDIHRLVLVFKLPHVLHGVTMLRSRGTSWPGGFDDVELETVRLVSKAFEDRFRLRSNDQVEARFVFDPAVIERMTVLAHGEKIRAVAQDDQLVIDIVGEGRFDPISLATGAWDVSSIATSMTDVADMLDLASAVSETFRLKR